MKSIQALRRLFALLLIVTLLAGTAAAVAESYPPGAYYCNGSRVYVRSGPGSDYPAVYKLKRGDVVSAVSQKNGWMKVGYYNRKTDDEETGYVYRKYLYQASFSTKDNPTGPVYKTTANLRVRTQPSTSKGYVLAKLKKGAKVYALKQKGSWMFIVYKKGYGWVSAKYLKKVR